MPDDVALDPQLRARPSRTARLGTICIYQASSPEAIRLHADRAGLPVDEIVEGDRHRRSSGPTRL